MSTTSSFAQPDPGADRRPPIAFIRWVAAVFVLLAGVNIALSLHFGAIVGDLARIGGFAERDYAPGRPQPAPRVAPNTVALADADVVLLGDSFSNRLQWQGELEALTGQRTLTFQYGQVGCIANWLQWLHQNKLKPGALVVIESAERSFVSRFSHVATCPGITPVPVHRHLAVAGEKSWFDTDFSLDIVYQGRILLNSLRLGKQDAFRAGEVVNVALKRADRFTDRRADRLLYHADDEGKNDWTAAQVASALAGLSAERAAFEATGQRFAMLVMPDKSSVYRDDMVAPRVRASTVTSDLHAAGLAGVDTLACFRSLATTVPDFYLPDDTHMGVAAFRLFAASFARGQCVASAGAPASTAAQ
ncbi:MAG: hypothetical protein ABJD97_00830 [Betaproteobacteria bacterium]